MMGQAFIDALIEMTDGWVEELIDRHRDDFQGHLSLVADEGQLTLVDDEKGRLSVAEE